jgi:hypothetical protein
MRAESRALCRELLLRHLAMTAAHPPGKRVVGRHYTIPYGDLCIRAGVPHLTGVVGEFLLEVAEWCEAAGFPPLNALAVNGETGIAGEGYDGAGHFAIVDWPADVEACIRFNGYPASPPP